MKNLLKFIGIGLVLVMAVYSQGVSLDTPVEAAAAAIANNDIEWMENDSNNEGQVVKHYPATSAGGTSANTHDVRFYINDSDLDKVQDGVTTYTGNAGAAADNTIAAAVTIELDADEAATVDCDTDTNGNQACLGGVTDTAGYDSAATPKTALVANTLGVTVAGAVQTFAIDAQDDVNGTFSLSGNAVLTATNLLVATYKFNSPQTYAATSGTSAKRVKVTSTSDSTGEWVQISEVASQSVTTAAIASNYFTGTLQVGSDATYATAADSTVWVQDGDTLTVTFYGAGTDSDGDGTIQDDELGSVIASTTATIDDSSPSISNVSPADGLLTKDKAPDISFTITDAGSGFGSSVTSFGDYVAVYLRECLISDAELGVSSFASDSITVTYTPPVALEYNDTALTGAAGAVDCTEAGGAENDRGALRNQVSGTSGFEIDDTTRTANATDKRTHHGVRFPWKIVVTDKAGNSKSLGKTALADPLDPNESDLDIIIDATAPSLTSITAAKAWDSVKKADKTDNSSIKLLWTETMDMDSITASDFVVSGTGVTSAEIVSITSGGSGSGAEGTIVYLDLGADLGPNGKPKVKLVSGVKDLAGNEYKPSSSQMTNNGGITLGTAADGVKPTLSGMAVADALLDTKDTTTISLSSNENLTKTNETLANGCTCGSVTKATAATDLSGAADNAKLSVTLTTPTSGSASIKQISAPFNTTGIFGIAMVGRDSTGNKGVGGIVKVTDEDVSKYFTVAGKIGETQADGAWNANAEEVTIKLKNGPLADSDGDGELNDELIGMKVGGTAKLSTELDDIHIEHVDLGEAEDINLAMDNVTNFGGSGIAVGSTVKITYYYVAASNVVEIDTAAPSGTISPADGNSTTDTTPSISVTWDEDEYGWDSHTTVTLTKAEVKDPDGVVTDILADMTTTDNKSFYYKPTAAMALGEHTVTFKAEDANANASAETVSKFTVKARTKTEIAMSPGWNLISLPGEPADNAINTVITNSQITTVLTYDPSTPGGWLTAVRDGDSLTGTLTTIDASHAYWVLTNNSDKIKVDIPGYTGGVAAVPPAINIVVGWNLIPAVSLTGAASWDLDIYLAGLTWTKAKSWNAAGESWVEANSIVDNNATSMSSGSGYWLYATKAGTLVP